MLAEILIKENENCIELMVEIPIKLKKACVTLSMGASSLQSQEMTMKYRFRKNSQILKRIKS